MFASRLEETSRFPVAAEAEFLQCFLCQPRVYGDSFMEGGATLTALSKNAVEKGEGGGRTTLRRAVLLVLVASIMTIVIAGVALARIDYVGGGKWNHGATNSSVWSYYYHGSKCHSASIKSGSRVVSRSQKPPGYTARSSWQNTWRLESAYWNNRC